MSVTIGAEGTPATRELTGEKLVECGSVVTVQFQVTPVRTETYILTTNVPNFPHFDIDEKEDTDPKTLASLPTHIATNSEEGLALLGHGIGDTITIDGNLGTIIEIHNTFSFSPN